MRSKLFYKEALQVNFRTGGGGSGDGGTGGSGGGEGGTGK